MVHKPGKVVAEMGRHNVYEAVDPAISTISEKCLCNRVFTKISRSCLRGYIIISGNTFQTVSLCCFLGSMVQRYDVSLSLERPAAVTLHSRL